jgi:pimeloyl-ACP methyl ester carboxylesterase
LPINSHVLAAVICLLCLPLFFVLFEHLEERRDHRRYPPPGRFIPSGRRQLHVWEQGTGEPIVILESGLAASSLSWILTQPSIAEFTRVIAYDRAGLGWSSPSESPPHLDDLLSDLNALIDTLTISTPLILVGHSFGGLLVRAFAHRYPDKVKGLLLIDPVSLDTYSDADSLPVQRLQTAIRLSKRGAFLARIAIVRIALALVSSGSRKLPAFVGRVSAGKGGSVMNRLAAEVAKLPSDTHGPIAAHWSRPRSFRLMADYLLLLPEAAQRVRDLPIPPNIPIIVLSAASATPAELAERDGWITNCPFSRHTQVQNTSHWLQLDRPDLVTAAVRELALHIK